MNKQSYLRFGSVRRLLVGIWLMFALIIVFGANAYAQVEPGMLTVTMELAGDPAPNPLPAFDVLVDGATVLTAPGSVTVNAAAGGQTFVVGEQTLPGPEWQLRVACTATIGLQTPNTGEGTINVPVGDDEAVTCAITNEYTAPSEGGNGTVVLPTEVPPTTTEAPTIADIVVGGGFDTLLAALNAAGLTDIFADPTGGPYTVFAPTNAAFDALPAGTLESLLADPTGVLADVLNYHVVAGVLTSADLAGASTNLTTLLGEEIAVSTVNGSVVLTFLNGESVVISADISASNGIVHVINSVLIPPPAPTPTPTEIPGGTNVLPDADEDGIPDEVEDTNGDGDLTNDDADGDGIPNYLDTDSNNNGIPDGAEYDKDGDLVVDDADGDGVPDYLDDDTDTIDSNGNGVPDVAEYDKDGDGVVDDADGDGVPDYLDDDTDTIDSNGNGIPDVIEYDADGDGVPDDVDGDGILDYLDDFVTMPSITVLKAVQSSQEVPNGTLGTLMLPSLAAGETLVFIIGVANTGNVPLTDVNVTDILAGADSSECEAIFPATLDVGEKLTCIVTYTITDADVNNGQVVNEAVVQSQYGEMVVENSAISTFPSTDEASPLALRKFVVNHDDLDGGSTVTVNDVLNYLLVATNTGDSPLSGVMIADVLPGTAALICNGSGDTLAPGDELTCRTEYKVTEADVTAGVVSNVAFTMADDPFLIAVQVDNTQVFEPVETAVNLTNSSAQYSVALLIITVVAIIMAQLTSYVTRKEF